MNTGNLISLGGLIVTIIIFIIREVKTKQRIDLLQTNHLHGLSDNINDVKKIQIPRLEKIIAAATLKDTQFKQEIYDKINDARERIVRLETRCKEHHNGG